MARYRAPVFARVVTRRETHNKVPVELVFDRSALAMSTGESITVGVDLLAAAAEFDQEAVVAALTKLADALSGEADDAPNR